MKTYTKPEILFEEFSLNSSIAVVCALSDGATGATSNTCRFDLGGAWENVTIFNNGICDIPWSAESDGSLFDGNGNAICYHNPSETTQIFGSY